MKRGFSPMRRRDFVSLLGGAAAVQPFPVRAQRRSRPVRLGYLTGGSFKEVQLGYVREGLTRIGWSEGTDFTVKARFADFDYSLFPALSHELLSIGIDLLFAAGPETPMAHDPHRAQPRDLSSCSDQVE